MAYYGTVICVFGLSKSLIIDKLIGFQDNFHHINVSYRNDYPQTYIKLDVNQFDDVFLNILMRKATDWVCKKLGNFVISCNGYNIEKVVGNMLLDGNESVAFAESCTGGLLSDYITNIPGSSEYFHFSTVTYSNISKINVLGVLPSTIKQHGAIHEITAIEMAKGVRIIAGTTYGLSTTGIAGPGGGKGESPVGTVCIGLATHHSAFSRRFVFYNKQRLMNKKIFCIMALDILRKELGKYKC